MSPFDLQYLSFDGMLNPHGIAETAFPSYDGNLDQLTYHSEQIDENLFSLLLENYVPVTSEAPVTQSIYALGTLEAQVSQPQVSVTATPEPLENNKSFVKGVEKQCNDTKSKKKSSVDLTILIKLFNFDKDEHIINERTHDVYYCTRKVIDGKVNACIKYDCIKKLFPEIKYLKVVTINDKTGESTTDHNLSIEGNELNEIIIPMKTNGKSKETNKKVEKTNILSFEDENGKVKFCIKLKLRDSKTERRRFQKESKNKDRNSKIYDLINGFIEKYREDNEEALENSIRFALNVMFYALSKRTKKEIFDEEEELLKEAREELMRNPENETYAKFKKFIHEFVKKDERKKELLKLCFDALYMTFMDEPIDKFLKNFFENNKQYFENNNKYLKNNQIFFKFIKEYSKIRKSSKNVIVITKEELIKNKRKCDSITEDPQERKKQKFDRNGSIIGLTNK